MTYTFISITDFLSNTQSPSKEELELFSKHRDRFLRTNENESEEHQKIALIDFLSQSFAYVCNTNKRIDLSIYEDSKAKVLFEVKSLSNKSEFIKGNNLESKAFYESILYFLREYKTHNNNNLKYIILTNTQDFYLIDAREYLQFAKDKTILNAFDNCEKGQGVNTSTEKFYATLKDYLPTLNSTLEFTHFNIQDTPLALLYQALSPQVLLKRKTYIDANTLNQSFYDELLYILGLKEISQNGKVLIQASDTQNTFLDSIAKAFELSPQDDFETIFSLLTTWNNRILFLRLLESMLLSFKHIKKPFLDIDILKDFTDLNTLFFKILAIRENKRQSIPKELDSIPYLNSSLFDKTELEREGKEIKLLDSKTIAIFKHSILKKDKDYKDTKSLSLLDYLFRFLHAYDFTTTPKDIQDNIKINHDKLINASVLGLVFEKLNGYKEGSFYTPSFITSYMCKESLEKIVIDKFNIAFKSDAKTINELPRIARDENKTIQDLRTILFSIKICDPAVGSGHFLVSALNELVFIAYRLGILESLDFQTRLELDNEEIIIKKQGKILEYTKPNDKDEPQHKIQQELFNLKKEIIESCLFGVDINPNSCEITKLRLWIELLKYSYYIFENGKNTNTLETLPNIDINIKCGNSLISHFEVNESDLEGKPRENTLKWLINQKTEFANNFKEQIRIYKESVNAYKKALKDKKELIKTIENIKKLFKNTLLITMKDYKNLKENLKEFVSIYGDSVFDLETPFGMEMLKITRKQNFRFQPDLEHLEPRTLDSKGQKLLESIHNDFESLERIRSSQTFEWRFAFPEVLDSNGDFLGFDLVIGNPPYIRQEEIKHLKPHLQKAFSIYKGTSDIYTYFFEQGYKVLTPNGILSFITSNKYCRAGYGKLLRAFILANTQILHYIDLNGIKVFDSATVDTSILSFTKIDKSKGVKPDSRFDYAQPKYDTNSNAPLQVIPQSLLQSSLTKEGFIFFQDSTHQALKAKIERLGTPLKEWDISINYGIKTGYNEAFIIDSNKRDEILSNCDDTQVSLKPYPSLQESNSSSSLRGSEATEAIHKNKDSNNKVDCHDSATAESCNDKGKLMLTERQRTSELIKPILRGRDIKRYSYEWAGLWIINTHNGYTTSDLSLAQSLQELQQNASVITDKVIASQPTNLTQDTRIAKNTESSHCKTSAGSRSNPQATPKIKIPPIDINDYPALKAYLDTHWDKIAKRTDKGETPYNLRNCAYLEKFEKEKIVWAEMTNAPTFIYDNNSFFINQTCYFLIHKHNKYLLGILNSNLIHNYIKSISSNLGDGAFRWIKQYIEKLPIPKIDSTNKALSDEIISLVEQILDSKAKDPTTDTKELESKIDSLVYKLYHLTDDEIKIIEGK